LEPDPLQVPILIEKIISNAEAERDNRLVGLSDNRIRQLARVSVASLGLPQEQFIHLLDKLRATQLFQQCCRAPDIILLYSYGDNTNDRYNEPRVSCPQK